MRPLALLAGLAGAQRLDARFGHRGQVRIHHPRVVDPHPSLRGAACYGFAARHDFKSAVEASHVLASSVEAFEPDPSLRELYSDAADLQLMLRERLGDEIIAHQRAKHDDD